MKLGDITKSLGSGFRALGRGAKAHSPEICVVLGLAAAAAAIIFAVKESPKAHKLIEEKKAELGVEKLPVKETVKTTWKCFAPTVGFGLASAVLILSGSKISLDRTAAMGALYNVGRDALSDYKASVKENTDEETQKKIEHETAEKAAERAAEPVHTVQTYVNSGNAETFIDSLSGRQIITTMNAVDKAVNDFNSQLIDDNALPLNDWYWLVGLDENVVGDMLYWDMMRTGKLQVSYSATIKDGKPCIVINYDHAPMYMEDD